MQETLAKNARWFVVAASSGPEYTLLHDGCAVRGSECSMFARCEINTEGSAMPEPLGARRLRLRRHLANTLTCSEYFDTVGSSDLNYEWVSRRYYTSTAPNIIRSDSNMISKALASSDQRSRSVLRGDDKVLQAAQQSSSLSQGTPLLVGSIVNSLLSTSTPTGICNSCFSVTMPTDQYPLILPAPPSIKLEMSTIHFQAPKRKLYRKSINTSNACTECLPATEGQVILRSPYASKIFTRSSYGGTLNYN
ncbi:hypothetical protein BX600DRAFT_441769 [Xylariales sp. PMI_506]|nr:hypothetical protein BX600DRAFT_441769 [Xylariales sp. PMI_506]